MAAKIKFIFLEGKLGTITFLHTTVIFSNTFLIKILCCSATHEPTHIYFFSAVNKLKKNCMVSFYGWGSTASKLKALQGGSFLFTTKSPHLPGTHFINFGRMKGWLNLAVTQWFLNMGPLDWKSSTFKAVVKIQTIQAKLNKVLDFLNKTKEKPHHTSIIHPKTKVKKKSKMNWIIIQACRNET